MQALIGAPLRGMSTDSSKLRTYGSVPTAENPGSSLEQVAQMHKSRTIADLQSDVRKAASSSAESSAGGSSPSRLTPTIQMRRPSGGMAAPQEHDTDDEEEEEQFESGLGSAYLMPSRSTTTSPQMGAAPMRSDSIASSAFSSTSSNDTTLCSCRIYVSGAMLARTSSKPSRDNIVWVEKFHLDNLASLRSLEIEVVQTTAGRGGNVKSSTLGIVSLPIETIRRGEEVSGWFPIWSMPEDKERDASALYDPSGLDFARYGSELAGELKLTLNIAEHVILPLQSYTKLENTLCGPARSAIAQRLASIAGEDSLLPTFVKFSTVAGSATQLLMDLAQQEAESLGEDPDIELLFRGNTALSRSLDRFQQLVCFDWLSSSIGTFVRQICNYDCGVDFEELLLLNTQSTGTGSSFEISPRSTGPIPEVIDSFVYLVERMWEAIYENRHRCPPDLSAVLHFLRNLVNSRFKPSGSAGSGIQGVGAFVFLRLICPAITSPQLFGLAQSPPPSQCAKVLLMIAKVFLALANKRLEFDVEKEPVLHRFNTFLKQQASAYDDYITYVSSAESSPHQYRQKNVEDDDERTLATFATSAQRKLIHLHAEAIAAQESHLDKPLLLASLASEVARVFSIGPAEGRLPAISFTPQDAKSEAAFVEFLSLCCATDAQAQALAQLTLMGCW